MWLEADNDYLVNSDQVQFINLEELNSSLFKIYVTFLNDESLCVGTYDDYDEAQERFQEYLQHLKEQE